MSQEDWDVRTYTTSLHHHAKRHRDLHQPPPCICPRKHTQLCSKYAQALFRHGQKVAESRGLILVDTKYEFGKVSPSHRLLMQDVCFLGWRVGGRTGWRRPVGGAHHMLTQNHTNKQINRTRTGRSSSSTRCTRPTPPATGSRRPTTRARPRCVPWACVHELVDGDERIRIDAHVRFKSIGLLPTTTLLDTHRAWSQRTSTRSSSAFGSR